MEAYVISNTRKANRIYFGLDGRRKREKESKVAKRIPSVASCECEMEAKFGGEAMLDLMG